jgi:hypothetical protein
VLPTIAVDLQNDTEKMVGKNDFEFGPPGSELREAQEIEGAELAAMEAVPSDSRDERSALGGTALRGASQQLADESTSAETDDIAHIETAPDALRGDGNEDANNSELHTRNKTG